MTPAHPPHIASAPHAQAQDDPDGGAAVAPPPPAKPAKSPRSAAKTKPAPKPAAKPPTPLPPWNVVLLDDDDHSYDYVIEMLCRVLRHDAARAFLMAPRGSTPRAASSSFTAHRELAELKREQLVTFGIDPSNRLLPRRHERDPRAGGGVVGRHASPRDRR